MYRKDYLQKQLEQLGRVIAKAMDAIAGLKKDGLILEGIRLADENLQSEFNLGINDLMLLKPEETIAFLRDEKKLAPAQMDLLADLLFEMVGLYEADEQQLAVSNLADKTLLIYEYVNLSEKTFSLVRQQKTEALKAKRYESQ